MLKKIILLFVLYFFQIAYSQEDCNTAISLCGNSSINYTPSGIGNINEPVDSGTCLDVEHHSVWYKFTIATSGTLTFDLVPTGPVDYDWAIFGPNATCGNLGPAIRCNASGYLVATGMNMTNTNTSSAAGNTNPYCKYMNVTAGQTYYLYIDNWSSTVYTFNLTWGGTATFVSPFTNSTLAPNPFHQPGTPNINPSSPSEVNICSTNATFDFATLTSGILNGNQNFIVNYYNTANDANSGINPITSPVLVNTSNTYYYTITYQDPNNPGSNLNTCKQISSFIFVNHPITAAITASSTVLCPNGSVTLTSNNTTGNAWSTGATTSSISVTSPGTYTLTSSNGYCTSLPASVTITSSTNPNVQISGNLILCNGNSTTLTASATGAVGNSFVWSNGVTASSITVSTPGTYTVTYTTANGCQYQQSATVTQGTSATVQNATLHVCSSSATANFDLTSAQSSISTTPGATFSFYQNLADANAGNANTIANPTTYNSGNTTIYVLVQAGNCPKVAQLQLIVDPIPNPVITTSSTVLCNGGTVTLTSNYPTGNTWSNGQTTQSISVNTTGTYTLTNNSGNCTSSPTSITINPPTNPNVQISGNLSFCQGSSTTLTATADGTGNTFVWSNGTNGATNTVNTGGVYTVTVTTSQGCQYQQSVTVNMEPAVVVNIATPGQISCATPQITLNASNSVFVAGSSILWTSTGGGNIVSGANTLTPIVNSSGTYTCTITSNTSNACSGQSSVTVTGNSIAPTISISASPNSICVGDSVTLIASGAQTYSWTGLPGTGNTQTVSPTSTTTYSVTGVGANGCPANNTATITITVVPAITSTLTNGEICKGDEIVLNAGAGQNYTYQWNTGETTQTIIANTIGTYNVTINNGVCSELFSAVVTYKEVPEIQNIIYQNSTLTIIASTSTNQNLEYSIDGGFTWQNSNVFNDVKGNSTLHIFVRIIGESCFTTVNYDIFQINNVITPNGDGYNDVLDLTNYVRISQFSAEIYDRYGKIIFKASKENPIWDGSYLGRPLPTESYWYIIKWYDEANKKPVEFTGWILLKNRE